MTIKHCPKCNSIDVGALMGHCEWSPQAGKWILPDNAIPTGGNVASCYDCGWYGWVRDLITREETA